MKNESPMEILLKECPDLIGSQAGNVLICAEKDFNALKMKIIQLGIITESITILEDGSVKIVLVGSHRMEDSMDGLLGKKVTLINSENSTTTFRFLVSGKLQPWDRGYYFLELSQDEHITFSLESVIRVEDNLITVRVFKR